MPAVLSSPYTVNVEFWNDKQATNHYCNNFMFVYLQNKTYNPNTFDYNYKCYSAPYTSCVANIVVNDSNIYDLLIADGSITWNNVTGCPSKIENNEIWNTVQSNIPVNGNLNLDYYINVTLETKNPSGLFGNTMSAKALASAIYFVVLLVLIIGVQVLLIRAGQPPSGLIALVMLVIGILLKLILPI